MKLQGRRKRGRPKRRWLDKLKDDIKEKGLSADEVYDRATWRRTSTPHKSGNNMKEKKKKKTRQGSQVERIMYYYTEYTAGMTEY